VKVSCDAQVKVEAAASKISGTGDAPMPEKAAIEVADVKAAQKVDDDSEALTLISSDESNSLTVAGSPANGKVWKKGDALLKVSSFSLFVKHRQSVVVCSFKTGFVSLGRWSEPENVIKSSIHRIEMCN